MVTLVLYYCLHYIMIIQIITCLNLPYERGWCDCFCQLMMHCAGKHWSAHSCIMLTVRRGHTPRCSPHTHTCSVHNSPDMIYQGSPHHQVLGAIQILVWVRSFSLASDSPGLWSALDVDNWTGYLQLWFCSWYLGCRFNCVSYLSSRGLSACLA